MAAENKDKSSYLHRLAEYLACAPGTIKSALQRQSAQILAGGKARRLGEILRDQGSVSAEELDTAIRRQRIDRLRKCYVFSSLSRPELAALCTRFREVTVPEGYQFIIQDEEDPTLYVLASGRAEVYRTDMEGNWMHLAEIEAGAPIGEMGYFRGGRRTASVRALERCELLCANYDDLTHYFENVPRVAHAFITLVQKRQQEMEQIRETFEKGKP